MRSINSVDIRAPVDEGFDMLSGGDPAARRRGT